MKTREHEAVREFTNVMRQPQGVRFIRHLLQLSGVWSASYAGGDALATAYNEGRRSMGIYIMELVRAQTPELMEELLGWREERLHLKDAGKDVEED